MTRTLLMAVLVLTACKDDDKPPILDHTHMGWKSQDCSFCHSLPVEDHSATDPWRCAECHGGNGACDPNGSTRVHVAGDSCTSCHGNRHGFSEPSQCQACHFAAAGTDGCTATPEPEPDASGDVTVDPAGDGDGDPADVPADGTAPLLSSAVEESCFGWPETEFSPANHTTVLTGLAEGALAVELTLEDVDGTSYTLSELLADRPVLLIFGAFT